MESNSGDMIVALVVGTSIMLFLVFSIILFIFVYQKRQKANELKLTQLETEQQKELLSVSISSEEKERKRISQELHDDVGAQLSAVNMFISSLEEDLERGAVKEQVVDIKEMIGDSLERVRAISRLVSPSVLNKYGLMKAMAYLFESLSKVTKQTKLTFNSSEYQKQDDLIEITLYRITQELLNNALKYAQPSEIKGSLVIDNQDIVLVIESDGAHFNIEEALNNEQNMGVGLKNIKARLQTINANLSYIHTKEKNLTTIIVAL